MGKKHTRLKRKMGIRSTTRKHRYWFESAEAKTGPKGFRSKEKAEEWAKKQGIDKDAFYLHETLFGKFQWRRS